MRILILGANGMIGHKMYQILSEQYTDVWVTLRTKLSELSYADLYNRDKTEEGVDLSDFTNVTSVLEKVNPNVIINAAGITIRRGVNESVCTSILLNSALPHFLEEWVMKTAGKKVIHFSTDCVFSGKGGAYTEADEPDPKDYYGKTKALGEVSGPQALTLRGSMIGRELANHTELLEWFLSQKNKTIHGFNNAIYSGITTVQMAFFVRDIIRDFPMLSGICHVSSVPISKYELLKIFNEVFDVNAEIYADESYASRKDLVSSHFYSTTGFAIPEWKELAIQLKNDSIQYSNYYKN